MTAERIAAYLDGGLSPEAREGFERHLVICSKCRQGLAEASDLTGRSSSRWLVRAAPVAAAAAAVMLLWVGASEMLRQPGGEPTLRGPAAATQLDILSPLDGSLADPDSLVFRWRTASVDAHYVFTLTDANGDVVFTNGLTDTTLVLPRSVGLDPGVPYFWFVDALLDGARSMSTGVQEFVVERR
jgi:hypothetical protein